MGHFTKLEYKWYLHKSIISVLNLLTLTTIQFSDNILIIATQVRGKRVFGTPQKLVVLHFRKWSYALEKEDSKTFKANKKHRG